MRKSTFVFYLIVLLLIIVGCTSTIPEISEEALKEKQSVPVT